MQLKARVRLAVFVAAIGTVISLAAAPPPQGIATSPQTAGLNQAIPIDPEITVGQLPNGLRYYVRANKKPEKRAELRLVVKAGSTLEDDDQQGLAHFVEHMAFNGTANFPKQDITAFMQSLGMRFGAHVNAYTSFDETVYMLTIPSERMDVLDRALLVLDDWAHNVTFDPAEIEKERGVVMEEWRGRLGAGSRLTDKLFPILLQNSRYADRLPIGKPEILQKFAPSRLKQFYTDWYRPDLMAVVAVGDFDRAAVEKMIVSRFSSLLPSANPRKRPTYDIPDRPSTVFAIVSDKEATTTSVELDALLPAKEQGPVGVYREKIVDRLFESMLNARLGDLAQKPDAPFLMAGADRSIFLARTKEQASLTAIVKEDGVEKGLAAILAELERVSRFGFTAAEMDRVRQATMTAYERVLTEKDNRESDDRAAEYIRNFLEQETLPTIEREVGLQRRFLTSMTLEEVNRRAKEWFPDRNRTVVVTAPEKPGLVLPDQARLAAVLKAAAAQPLTAYSETVSKAPLLDAPPKPGSIARTSTRSGAGVTEWELSNGVKVVLKPTNFKEDEILFRAFSPGGTSLASDSDYVPAATAVQVVTAGGVGKLSAIDLRKLMTGKSASAQPTIGELDEGLRGSSSKADLETMFQLIYLAFTQPRQDPTAFGVQSSQTKTILANQAVVPEMAFVETLNGVLSQNHVRRRLPTPASVDQWNLDKSFAFYKDRFADASDFTFVFVGSFDVDTIRPFVERYLATLPSLRRKETWKDVGVRLPKGVIERTVEKGTEPKSQTALVFTGPFDYNQTERVVIRAMAQVLQGDLMNAIREDLGGTYGVATVANYSRVPVPEYSVLIQFGSDPARVDALMARVFQEIEALKTDGPSPQQVAEVKLALQRDFETSSRTNSFLLSQIVAKYEAGEDVEGLWDVPKYYDKLDAAAIREAAKKYLDKSNYVRVTLKPQKN
jgi:zinc protease